jgi:hypothetical protein
VTCHRRNAALALSTRHNTVMAGLVLAIHVLPY